MAKVNLQFQAVEYHLALDAAEFDWLFAKLKTGSEFEKKDDANMRKHLWNAMKKASLAVTMAEANRVEIDN